ncbi:MAG: hypothetical protein KGZ51_05635 [Erysipelothrix sp.]|jgi:hypothetical protein|nr:hypothetical protein [Erysipelothrix sp.]
MIQLPNSNELDTLAFTSMFTHLTNSYKLFWFKAIFDRVISGEANIQISDLTSKIIEYAFPLIHTYKLNFGGADQLKVTLKTIPDNYSGRTDAKSICNAIPNIQEVKFRNQIKNYVPYRLLSPFYRDIISGIKDDNKKNQLILQASNSDHFSFYKIDLSVDSIIVNPLWINYILSNQSLIDAWFKYHLITFLQSRNPSTPNIPFKVDSSMISRSLNLQQKYWNFAIKANPSLNFDIYIKEEFSNDSISKYGMLSLDHVIPFDFVMHNELWNLTPIHRNINSAKSNHLPSLNFIYEVANQNYEFFKTIQVFYPLNPRERHPLEDYEYLNPLLNHKNFEIHKDDFTQIMMGQLTSLHTIAKNQGFSIWQPFSKID